MFYIGVYADLLSSCGIFCTGPQDTDLRDKVESAPYTSQRKSPMLDRFLKETVKEGHFTGLGEANSVHGKDAGKAKL